MRFSTQSEHPSLLSTQNNNERIIVGKGEKKLESTFSIFFFIFFSLSAAIMKTRTRIFPRQQYTLDIHIIVNDGLQSDAQGMRRGNKKKISGAFFSY